MKHEAAPDYTSWGRVFQYAHEVSRPAWINEEIPALRQSVKFVLPYGLGRSYGDSCLNEAGILIDTASLNRFIAFDNETGLLRCEAGTTLADIGTHFVPRGFFLPVTPGTKFVTVGGAIANDVHGKNHHVAGTFGRHVTRFELLRSDGSRLLCSPTENTNLFRATIGGLGLTGLITWAEFRLRRINSPLIAAEEEKFANLDEFFSLSAESDSKFEYTVSWVDCLAKGDRLGRGIFIRGNHADMPSGMLPTEAARRGVIHAEPRLAVPIEFPNIALNRLSVWGFNQLYYGKQLSRLRRRLMSFDPFFYPLDAVAHWNRIYGRRGFFQYQFVLPEETAPAIKDLFRVIADSGQASFLAVLKKFGAVDSPGLLSFPTPGVTLALDFPNNGARTVELFRRLNDIINANNGRMYPAKDSIMTPRAFQRYYPQWTELARFRDPRFSSSFWRRVTSDV